jgi:hypothetical protein
MSKFRLVFRTVCAALKERPDTSHFMKQRRVVLLMRCSHMQKL